MAIKTLYIARHAKSCRDDPGLSDFDRPLPKYTKKPMGIPENICRSIECFSWDPDWYGGLFR